MKAEVKKDDCGLWLIIDGQDGTAWAVMEEELIPIKEAIENYLEEESQNIMKED